MLRPRQLEEQLDEDDKIVLLSLRNDMRNHLGF